MDERYVIESCKLSKGKDGGAEADIYLKDKGTHDYNEAWNFVNEHFGELSAISRYRIHVRWNAAYEEVLPSKEIKAVLWQFIVQYVQKNYLSRYSFFLLATTKFKMTEAGVKITFAMGQLSIVNYRGYEIPFGEVLRELFGRPVKVTLDESEEKTEKKEYNNFADAGDFDRELYEKACAEGIERNKQASQKGKKSGGGGAYYSQSRGAAGGDSYRGQGGGQKKKRRLTPEEGEELKKDSKGNTILIGGEIFDKPTEIAKLNGDMGYVAVRGRVFRLEVKQIPSGSYIASVSITDETDSIVCKFFFDESDMDFVNKKFGAGAHLTVYGDIVYDKYERDVRLQVRNATTYKPVKRMDNAENKRVELHLHTTLSAEDAITRPGALIKRLKDWGHTAVAITDHGVVQAYPDIFNAVAKEKSDIKIIYGIECYLTDQQGEIPKEVAKNVPSWHCIILVKNLTGLKNLYKLISKSYLNYFYKRPRMPRFEIDSMREGLIIGSACSEGELFHAMVEGASEEQLENIASWYDYLEIQPAKNNMYLVREGKAESLRALENYNKRILKLADKLGKLCVATCDVHFLDPGDAIYRCVMQTAKGFSDADEQPPIFLRTTDEMLDEFPYLGERAYEVVVENTNKIADMIERIRPVPEGNFPPSIEGSDEEFRSICYQRAKETYGDPVPAHIMERLDKELNPIIENGYSVMYMAAQKLVAHSASNGYTVGSRGSVGSSLAAYMAGITEVNALPPHYRCPDCFYQEFFFNQEYEAGCDMPPKDCPNCHKPLIRDGFDIPFETFLGFNADKTPDIDLNFASEDQARAHKYCEVMFGADYVFRAGTISGLADKTARGYVLKYLETKGKTANDAEIDRLAEGFQGVKKTTGQHPGGIMVVPKDMDIFDFTPIQHPADDPDSGTITTHFDYHFLHDSILKLDILGHDGPEIVKMLEDFTGVPISQVDISDPRVMSLFTSPEELDIDYDIMPIDIETGTWGIPEFGTRFAIGLLKSTQPHTVSELVRISGLSHGTDVWQGNASELIENGTATLSECICCRDDIMLYLIKMGLEKKTAFSIMESVRKGKVAKKKEDKWPAWKEDMKAHNVPDWYLQSCEKIQYMFPRAHAVAYVMLSVRMAWYKLYYPLAYYATRFTLKISDFDAINMCHGIEKAYRAMQEVQKIDKKSAKDEDQLVVYEQLMEMYARHIKFLPIDLYKSKAALFVPEEDGLRPPFCALAGVGESAGIALEKARDDGGGVFETIEDLQIRSGVNKAVIEALRNDGVLEGMPENDTLSLFDV